MKNLLIIFALFASSFMFSQTYEGTATVSMVSGDYASIVFGRNGHSPSTFIIKLSELDQNKTKLEEHKKYYFILKRVKFKGTKKTAEVLFHEKDKTQIFKEMNEVKDKIKETIIWL